MDNVEMVNGTNDDPAGLIYQSNSTKWLVGLALVTLISSCAAVGIILLPILGPKRYKRMLSWCIGLGAGSLSGSAVFHLLPNAVDFDATTGNNPYLLWLLLAGIYVFYVLENVIHYVTSRRRWYKLNSERSISDSAKSPNFAVNTVCLKSVLPLSSKMEESLAKEGEELRCEPNGHGFAQMPARRSFKSQDIRRNLVSVTSDLRCQEHSICDEEKSIATVAWMIIIGDSVHNFIDGLSIGAAFNQNLFTGISICIAVLCEEFPHELGDVAILISSGMSIKQALFYNVLSALTCYVGFVMGMLLGGIGSMDRLIFAFAGGMFLFISLGNMVPEMNGKVQEKLKKHPSRGVKLFLVQSSGILTGALCLFALAMLSEQIKIQ